MGQDLFFSLAGELFTLNEPLKHQNIDHDKTMNFIWIKIFNYFLFVIFRRSLYDIFFLERQVIGSLLIVN